MKRLFARILTLLAVSSVLFCTVCGAARAEAEASVQTPLRFGEDGSFTIMLLADAQDTQFPPVYLRRSIEAVLNNYHVDLVVLLGDQLEGGSPLLRLGNGRRNVERALDNILAPIEEAGVPFAFVLGNHDYEAPLSAEQQDAIYRSYANCAAPVADASGAYRIGVYDASGESVRLNLFFFESGPDAADGGYGAVSADQVAWYQNVSENLYAEAGNQTTPAVAFQHVIVREVYELFTDAKPGTPGALSALGGASYLPSAADMLLGEAGEAPCPSNENYGLFDAFTQQGDVFLAMAGHDHLNSFIGRVRGVDLGAAPGSSYTSYGSADARGVRLLRFNEDDVMSYDTIHVLYSDYVKTSGISAVRYYLTTTTAIPNLVKAAVLSLLIAAVIVLLLVWILRGKKHPVPTADESCADTGYDDDPAEALKKEEKS